ncbi:hypothetical protein BN2537_213 [Streptomyces venezuelae]|nr:hypothetical protein BN2537_213 [Streptomyces venezuelae]
MANAPPTESAESNGSILRHNASVITIEGTRSRHSGGDQRR